jgi:CheY-like chemotaxis protein
MLNWIFEPFSQADKSLYRSRSGLGLGLSLVKGIVELHGGTVEARSDGVGRGSQFIIRLPLERSATVAAPSTLPDVRGTPGRYRILLIEDNPAAARSMRMLLEHIGHTVEVALSGPDGVEAARKFLPEVVCDIGLPGLDGYAVAQALREQVGLRDTYLIGVSGYAQNEQRGRESGFDAYLTKPVDFDELERMLATLGGRAEAIA